jgi:hypothetical protein
VPLAMNHARTPQASPLRPWRQKVVWRYGPPGHLYRYSARVVTWPDAIERISNGQPQDLDLRRTRFRFSRTPLVITGNSGAGKTKIWSALTRRPYEHESSLVEDDGYMLRPNSKALALTTIPGQDCKGRAAAMGRLFGPHTIVQGVIFVACNGYDHIWPTRRHIVASGLSPYDLESLRARNLRKELSKFGETCDRIIEKFLMASEYAPKWLLVVTNKLDLYWDRRTEAENYYLPGSGSEFDEVAQDFQRQMGALAIQYDVLPLATASSGYRFQSNRGTIEVASQLPDDKCATSAACLVEALEDRCDL